MILTKGMQRCPVLVFGFYLKLFSFFREKSNLLNLI